MPILSYDGRRGKEEVIVLFVRILMICGQDYIKMPKKIFSIVRWNGRARGNRTQSLGYEPSVLPLDDLRNIHGSSLRIRTET